MEYLIFLFLSAIFTNGAHGYLLYSQKHNRKWSISEHAVVDIRAFTVYIIGHIVGGAFFILFAYDYFVTIADSTGLFYLACFVVFFEYVQAFLPARGKTNFAHSLAAYIMWVSFIALGVMSLFVLDIEITKKIVPAILMFVVLVIFAYAHFDRQKLYKYQMIMVPVFYAAMFVLIL